MGIPVGLISKLTAFPSRCICRMRSRDPQAIQENAQGPLAVLYGFHESNMGILVRFIFKYDAFPLRFNCGLRSKATGWISKELKKTFQGPWLYYINFHDFATECPLGLMNWEPSGALVPHAIRLGASIPGCIDICMSFVAPGGLI